MGTSTFSAAETAYNPAPKEHVLACSWVGSGFLAAVVRKLPWWRWPFQLSPRHRRQLVSSELAGAARGCRVQLLRSSLRCNTRPPSSCFLQPCWPHVAQESLLLIYSAYIRTYLWPLGGAGHPNVAVESSTGGRAIKTRFCHLWPDVFVPLFVLCLWKVQPCLCSAFSALTDLPAMWIKSSPNPVISNQIKC